MNTFNNEYIHPIRIPTPFLVGDVYCYLITDEKIVLVDCGHLSYESEQIISEAFHKKGLALYDIDEIWLTHGHPDHFGLAARLRERSGAAVYGHPNEANNFGNNEDATLFLHFFEQHGVPESLNQMMQQQLAWLQTWQEWIEPDYWLDEQDRLETGIYRFHIKHLPGHAPGHVAYYNDEIILSGDVLIKHISTNAVINFDPNTRNRNRSLLQQRQSLHWIEQQSAPVLPGHGKRITHPKQIARRHLKNQQKRFEKILMEIQRFNRPFSLYELTQQMFPQIHEPAQTFLTLSEVMGYLDWAEQKGRIERLTENESVLYRPISALE